MADPFDTIVVGNHWTAVNAACASAQAGVKTLLLKPGRNTGGIIAFGLGKIDFGTYASAGALGSWLIMEFFRRITQGNRTRISTVTPSGAERAFDDMLKYYGVYIRQDMPVASVQKTGAAITSVTTADGSVFTLNPNGNAIDCTEDGDTAVLAGVPMVVGCESAATYGETLGGWQPHFDTFTPMDCYQSPGVLLPGIKAFPVGLAVGDAFAGVQAYTFRLCVTDDLVNKAPWPKPAGYDPLQFEYLRRQAPLSDPNWKPFSLNPVGGGKYDINGDFFSPEQWDWSNANAATRATLLQLAYKRQAGWFWFLANDPSVNSTTQAYVNSVGLCRDEFLGGGLVSGWPYELYSRVSRRMVGQYVMRESDLITNTTKTKVIALGFYSRDQHESALYAVEVGGIPGFIKDGANAGDVDARQVVPGYHQSLEAFLPVATDCNNLIVVNAASMSAVAAASMRIDMHKASAAAALGYAAAKCVITGANINVLDVAALQLDLTARGHPLSFTPPA